MIVHAQVDVAVEPPTIRATGTCDIQGCRLAPTPAAAGLLAGVERGDESLGKLARGCTETRGHRAYHLRACQDIALAGKTLADLMPGPLETGPPGVCCRAPLAVDQPHLPVLAVRIGREQPAQRLL